MILPVTPVLTNGLLDYEASVEKYAAELQWLNVALLAVIANIPQAVQAQEESQKGDLLWVYGVASRLGPSPWAYNYILDQVQRYLSRHGWVTSDGAWWQRAKQTTEGET